VKIADRNSLKDIATQQAETLVHVRYKLYLIYFIMQFGENHLLIMLVLYHKELLQNLRKI
jgi:hypothetical protein